MNEPTAHPIVVLPSDGQFGSIEVSCNGSWTAGARRRIEITYNVGPTGLPQGSVIKLAPPNTAWDQPLVPFARYWDDVEEGDHVHYVPFKRVNTVAGVHSRGKARVHLNVDERMLAEGVSSEVGFWRWWISATVEGDDLACGDRMTIHYGTPLHGEQDIQLQKWAGDVCFVAFTRLAGQRKFHQVGGSPYYVEVKPGPPAKMRVVIPSIIGPGKSLSAKVSVTDEWGCIPLSPFDGKVALACREGSGQLQLRKANFGRTELQPQNGNMIRVSAQSEGFPVAESNRALVEDSDLKLYWGDLHAQSRYHVFNYASSFSYSDPASSLSSGEPEEVYAYGRDIAGLDFVAITDQGGICSPAWEKTQQMAAELYQPGSFVTFKAYEAGVLSGHRNVIYADARVEGPQDPRTFKLDPEDLYRHYHGRRDVIMIPHHVKIWTNWDYHDPDLEPLVEVYSTWGSSEKPGVDEYWDKGMTPGSATQAAWARGYRMGVVASSDSHVGMPGRSVPNGDRQWSCQNFRAGLAAVWCKELTRESVFAALRNRSCYGTTGARMIVQFDVNGHPMGSQVRLEDPGQPCRIHARIVGSDRIDHIEIVKNNRDVHRVVPARSDEVELEWIDPDPCLNSWYYLRVTQADGHRAWTSPVWVDAG